MSSYINHRGFFYNSSPDHDGIWYPPHSWREHTRRNLAQHYEPERVARIMAGADPRTQADIARWDNLGQRSAA